MKTMVFQLRSGETLTVAATGTFLLEKKISEKKKKSFVMTNLLSEIPQGKDASQRNYFYTDNGTAVNSLYVSRIQTYFKPDENPYEAKNVLALIEHSDVRVASMTDEEHADLVRDQKKISNPKFILTNIDLVRDEEHERMKERVKALNLIFSSDLSAIKLAHICSDLNIAYNIKETFKDAKKAALENKIQRWIELDPKNPNILINKIENLAALEDSFYFDHMVRFGLITNDGGFYKINAKPIGTNRDNSISYLRMNVEEYNFLKVEVNKLFKIEKGK